MIQSSRRSFITGLGALFISAPAIVRASSLMPVKTFKYWDLNACTKEAIQLFKNSNLFLHNIYDDSFAVDGYKIGATLRIKLPNDYQVVA